MSFFTGVGKLIFRNRGAIENRTVENTRLTSKEKTAIAAGLGTILAVILTGTITFLLSM